MRKLAAEKLTGVQAVSYNDKNMQTGIELETSAREYYEIVKGCIVTEVGFVERDDNIGASPDGLVGEKGGLEVKSPIPSTHIEYRLSGKFPTIYKPQVQGNLWVAEKEWWDFVSYCPGMPKPFFCVRVERDEEYIKELAIQVEIFVTELKEMIEKLTVNEF